jgi:hypothetical protein
MCLGLEYIMMNELNKNEIYFFDLNVVNLPSYIYLWYKQKQQMLCLGMYATGKYGFSDTLPLLTPPRFSPATLYAKAHAHVVWSEWLGILAHVSFLPRIGRNCTKYVIHVCRATGANPQPMGTSVGFSPMKQETGSSSYRKAVQN